MKIYRVDAFTDKPLSGNPAGVCILDGQKEDKWMQDVAREMNLSETAFILRQGDSFSLRWFTPAVEVDLCGHATLASAHVLWETGAVKGGAQITFQTRSGPLHVVKRGEWIEMDFPAEPETQCACPAVLAKALGAQPAYCGRNRFDYLVELESEDRVRTLQPDFRLLGTVDMRGVIVTALSSRPEFDYVLRFFAPAVGVDEDPVTGSAQCCLGPYWGKRLGKQEVMGFQASARGGEVKVRNKPPRVLISGKALTGKAVEVLTGE